MTDGYDMEATIRNLSNKLRLSESLKDGYIVTANELKAENDRLRAALKEIIENIPWAEQIAREALEQ